MNIPGYYFDEEKKKYFKIQPGHKLPAGSKYSQANVDKEARFHKRLKQEQEIREKWHRTRVSRHESSRPRSVSAITLSRETGLQTTRSSIENDVGSAFFSTFQRFESCRVQHGMEDETTSSIRAAFAIPFCSQLIVEHPSLCVTLKWDNLTMQQELQYDDAAITYANTTIYPGLHRTFIAPTNDIARHISSMRADAQKIEWLSCSFDKTSIHFRRHNVHVPGLPTPSYLHDIAFDEQERFALATSTHLLYFDAQSFRSAITLRSEPNSIDWLSQNVIIAGQGREVRLWDIRAQASVSRIRNSKRTTGVRSIKASDGTQILVADNYGLKLYDLRMTSRRRDRYPMIFEGVHEGPRLQFDINELGVVLAYQDEALKLMSLYSGNTTKITPPPWVSTPSQVIWSKDAMDVPYVQMCANNVIYRWSSRKKVED